MLTPADTIRPGDSPPPAENANLSGGKRPPTTTHDGVSAGRSGGSIPGKVRASSLCRFLVAFYFSWMGVATLNHIDQRKDLLAYVDARYSEGILKAKALIDLLLASNIAPARAQNTGGAVVANGAAPTPAAGGPASSAPPGIGFPHIQNELIQHKRQLDLLEKARTEINALIMTGARTTDRTLVQIEQRVFFNDPKGSDGEGMDIIENFLLLKPVIWKTSTGLLIGMLSIMAAVVGAMVYTTKDSVDLDFFGRLAAGVGAGIICYFIVKSGAHIFASQDGFLSYSPYVSALISFIAGLYFIRFYDFLLKWTQERINK